MRGERSPRWREMALWGSARRSSLEKSSATTATISWTHPRPGRKGVTSEWTRRAGRSSLASPGLKWWCRSRNWVSSPLKKVFYGLLGVPKGDPGFAQVVRGNFHLHFVADADADE